MIKKVFVSKNGVVFYWIKRNTTVYDKECLFLCHGMHSEHTLFDHQIKFWSLFYNIVVWDMPMHGASLPYFNFTIENAADDLKSILDTENFSRCILMGQSAGGYICQSFIRLYPEMVKAFVAIDTLPLEKKYYKKTELLILKLFPYLVSLYPFGLYCQRNARMVSFTEEGVNNFYNSIVKLGKRDMQNAVKKVFSSLLNELNREQPMLMSLKIPTLLVVGENDTLGFVKPINDAWAKETGLPLIMIKKAGHNSNFDNFEEFNWKTFGFLRSQNLITPHQTDAIARKEILNI